MLESVGKEHTHGARERASAHELSRCDERETKANHSPSSALKSRGNSALPVLGTDAKLGEKVSRPL